ncbi:hypothetical protein AHF37_08086 [Paragonimus kellicotti]|nr:hypothetical protein AHF37_08086 [Paragonimus kellicotti]
MSEKDSRIRELEQALRESVRLTAEREIYASGRDDESRHLESQGIMSEKDSRIRELEQALRESVRLTAEREIYASGRDDESRHLESQFQNYLPELEKLRRANHEANLRVAAMVKLTQGHEHTLTDQDRAVVSFLYVNWLILSHRII